MLLDAVWTDYQEQVAKPSAHSAFWRAEALFELGKTEEGRRLVNRGLDQLVPGNKENRWIHGGNSGFTVWPGLDCYIRYEPFLDDATKQRYRQIYTGAVFYKRLTTSNHKIMAAAGRYLATQIWGADGFHPDPFFQGKEDDGAYFTKGDPTGEKYVCSIIEETVKSGPGEYASRPYGAENILPLLSIAECAHDSELRQRAALAYECAILQLAPCDLRGHLAAFRDRLLAKSKIEFQAAEKPVGRYTDRAGHTLECVFDGPDKIDGTPVDYTQWPVLENSWMRQLLPAGPLTVTVAQHPWRYDFQQWQRLGPTENLK